MEFEFKFKLEFELEKGEKKIENKIEKDKNPGWASDFPFGPTQKHSRGPSTKGVRRRDDPTRQTPSARFLGISLECGAGPSSARACKLAEVWDPPVSAFLSLATA